MTRRRLAMLLAAAATVAVAAGSGAPVADATLPGPNGRIAFWDFTTGQVYTVAPDGSALRRLTNVDSSHAAIRPKWSPDGRRIIFTLVRANTPDDNARIWIMRADGTHARQLSHDSPGFRNYAGGFTPDGRRIVFARCQPDDGVCAIWQMHADGTHMQALTPFRVGRDEAVDFTPTVSARGAILFTRFFWHGIASRVWVISHGHRRPVTPARLEAAGGDWAPSGRAFSFNSNSQRFNASLYRIGTAGTGLHRLTTTAYPHSDFDPTYSPDGNRIAFASDRRYPDLCCVDLFAARADGSHLHRIPTGGLNGILEPAWGPRAGGGSSTAAVAMRAQPRRAPVKLPAVCAAERLGTRPYC
jgi:Tol biopolymer transport system component